MNGTTDAGRTARRMWRWGPAEGAGSVMPHEAMLGDEDELLERMAWTPGKAKRKRTMPKDVEDGAQIAIINRLALYGIVCHHSPNEGRRTSWERLRLTRIGTRWGWPDLDCLQAPGRVAFLETKTPIGKLSDKQIAIHQMLREMGHFVAVALDQDQAVAALREAGFKF